MLARTGGPYRPGELVNLHACIASCCLVAAWRRALSRIAHMRTSMYDPFGTGRYEIIWPIALNVSASVSRVKQPTA